MVPIPQRPAVLSEEEGGGREKRGKERGREREDREEEGKAQGGWRRREVLNRQRQEKHCGKRLGGRTAHSWDLTSGTQDFGF